jgi:mono/diheme cytochrome c family protein
MGVIFRGSLLQRLKPTAEIEIRPLPPRAADRRLRIGTIGSKIRASTMGFAAINPQTGCAFSRCALALLAWAAILARPALGADGRDVFVANCAPCHGPDGKAHTPAGRKLGAKDLTLSKFTDADVKKQVTEGFKDQRGLVMPAFKDVLPSDQVDAVVAFVMSLRK